VNYAYDALGRRVKRTQGSNVLKYTYDGQDVVLDDLNSTITTYQNGPGIDDKLKTKTGTTSQYYLQDHLGSTVALTNSSGAVNESQAYDSFGNRTNTTFSNRYQFTGREYDPTTGLQYSRARWYDPQLGRFISEDSIGFGGGDVNLYTYVGNRPIAMVDPSGQFGWCRDGDNKPMPCSYKWSFLPHELFVTKQSSHDAGQRAQATKFPNGPADPYGGAYRHCVASCYLNRRYGPFGIVIRTMWDLINENPDDPNSQGDMRGETVGEVLCGDKGTCEDICLGQYPIL
jgi:RHS repeat-associated protein